MADTSPAEIILNNSVNTNQLIRQLQGVIKAPVPHVDVVLFPATKAKIAAFQDDLQGYIDKLTAQREKVVALIQQIPDQTAQNVLLMRYGLTKSGQGLTSWVKLELELGYSQSNLFRVHRKGIEQLNQILKKGQSA